MKPKRLRSVLLVLLLLGGAAAHAQKKIVIGYTAVPWRADSGTTTGTTTPSSLRAFVS